MRNRIGYSGLERGRTMHPDEATLALFAGGELSRVERWRVGWHVSRCAACEAMVRDHKEAAELLRNELNVLPERLHWDRLAAEMTGNIRVGVAAGQCVAPVLTRASRRFDWQAAGVFAAATVIVAGAYWLNLSTGRGGLTRLPAKAGVVRTIAPGVTLEAKDEAIELQKNGSRFVLMHSNSDNGTAIYGSAPGSLRVSFVDKDSGQVTINRVYAD
jgi:hypothetical protein